MLRWMTNDDEATQRRAETARKRQRREDEFEYRLGKLFEEGLGLGKFLYKTIEDILGKAGNMELNLTQLEESVSNLESEETEIAADVKTAGERFGELTEELQALEAGNVTQAQIDAIQARTDAAATAYAQIGTTLTSDTPAASGGSGSGGSGSGGGTDEEDGNDTNAPTKSVYVFTGSGSPDTSQWAASGFETTDTPPIPLFYFNGDSAAGETNGASVEGWTLYTGSTQVETKAS